MVNPADTVWSDRYEHFTTVSMSCRHSARQLLHMKYTEGLTALVIAERLKRTADAVYQNLSRLHHSLRACVERRLAGVSKTPATITTEEGHGMSALPGSRLDELFVRYWDNALSPTEVDELTTLLADDLVAREPFQILVAQARGCGGNANGPHSRC